MKHQVEHDYILMFVMNLRVLLIENLIDQLNHIQYDRQEVHRPKKNNDKLRGFLNKFLLEKHFQLNKEQYLICH